MPGDECIKSVCSRIVGAFHPLRVMLFNVKHSPNGEVKGFKLCVVMETADKAGDEKRIYLDIDSDIPFDVLVYTPREWDALLLEQHSFANRIMREGTCVYDSGPQ